jgi:small subunit ribosomal protein S1
VLDHYREQDVVEGRVAKVVTFGAFVEILPGVEGLVHISELAPHHVENPREVVQQGQAVNVRVLEIDGERRRLSLSLKRVEEGEQPVPRADGAESVHTTPDLKLTEEAFPSGSAVETADEFVGEVEAGEEIESEPAEREAEEGSPAVPEAATDLEESRAEVEANEVFAEADTATAAPAEEPTPSAQSDETEPDETQLDESQPAA